MSEVSLLERIREWGWRELVTVSVCLAYGIAAGIVLSLLTVTTKEKAKNLVTSIYDYSFSCSEIPAESSRGTPEGGSSSDQVAPSDVPPSRASLDEEWRFVLKGVWRSWRSIFFHNLVAVLLIVTTGVISHRVSAGLVMMNGYALGAVGTAFVRHGGQSIVGFVLAVAPHGVIELTAFCVAGAAGMRLSRVAYEETFIDRLEALPASWPVVLVVTPLLALAAAIESLGIGDFGCF